MNSPIALQVKCYQLPAGTKPTGHTIAQCTEIRRFVLTHPWQGIYDELISKIVTSFAGFIGGVATAEDAKKALCTYWQDDESELVGFNSDEEMKYANDLLVSLQLSRNIRVPHVFKVYIGQKPTGKPVAPPAVHHGVMCDGCDKTDPIVGTRYKCQVCPDYDLCSSCEAKGIHKEHTFQKMEAPFRTPFGPFGFGGPRTGGCRRQRQQQPQQQPNPTHLFGESLSHFLPVVNNPEELKRLGAHLKTMLEPFGVDVDYFVDNATRTEQPAAEKPKEDVKVPETAETTEPKPDAESKPVDETPKETPINQTPTVNETPLENPFLQALNMMKSFTTTADKDESKSLNSTVTTASTSTSAPIEDSFVNVDAEVEKEMKIIRAIESLKQMGYTDDSGWLMRLVIAKDGNINAVLDALVPK